MGLLAIDATLSGDVSEIKIPGLARNRADIVIDSGFNPEDTAKNWNWQNKLRKQGNRLLSLRILSRLWFCRY